MREYLYLDACPAEETCVAVSATEDYVPAMRAETQRYVDMLRALFPQAESFGVAFRLMWESHDFGRYASVKVSYDSSDDRALGYALFIDSHLPARWSDTQPRLYDPDADARAAA